MAQTLTILRDGSQTATYARKIGNPCRQIRLIAGIISPALDVLAIDSETKVILISASEYIYVTTDPLFSLPTANDWSSIYRASLQPNQLDVSADEPLYFMSRSDADVCVELLKL